MHVPQRRSSILSSAAKEPDDALVIVDAVLRGDQIVVPAVVLKQLAAALPECAQIGVGGVEKRRELRLTLEKCLIVRRVRELERPPVPIGVSEHEPLVVRDRNREGIRRIAVGPCRLASAFEAGIQLRAGPGIFESAVHATSSLDLRRREARVR